MLQTSTCKTSYGRRRAKLWLGGGKVGWCSLVSNSGETLLQSLNLDPKAVHMDSRHPFCGDDDVLRRKALRWEVLDVPTRISA